jgi:hypothetical protein
MIHRFALSHDPAFMHATLYLNSRDDIHIMFDNQREVPSFLMADTIESMTLIYRGALRWWFINKSNLVSMQRQWRYRNFQIPSRGP